MTSTCTSWILWMVTALVGLSSGQFPDSDYCDMICPRGRHTLCSYKAAGPNCVKVKSLMNEDGRIKILSLHNSFRNAVAGGELKAVPMSSNMRQLYWDLELEAIAERWALQCNASYNDECRNVNRFEVGQIISRSHITSRSVNYYEALLNKHWFPEVENLSEDVILSSRRPRTVKHVAQILSARTKRIGCADVLYTTVTGGKPVRMTVCNYGPIVWNGEPIYRIGKPCSECPQQTECREGFGTFPHLCTELRLFDVIELEKSYEVFQREYEDNDVGAIPIEPQIFIKENQYPRIHHQINIPNYIKNQQQKTVGSINELMVGARNLNESEVTNEHGKVNEDHEHLDPEFRQNGTDGEDVRKASTIDGEEFHPPDPSEAEPEKPKEINNEKLPTREKSKKPNVTIPTHFPVPVARASSFEAKEILRYVLTQVVIVLTAVKLNRRN